MKFEDAAKQLDPEIYQRFKTALELGKWPDGRLLSKEQKEICLQAIMMYEAQHDIPEQERVGFIDKEKRKKKSDPAIPDEDLSPLRILH